MIIESPLHPFLVHLPLGLVAVLPVLSTWALIARRRSSTPGMIWAVVVALHAGLAVSAWFAAEVGERSLHIVEPVVQERFLDMHTEAGDRLQLATGVAFLVCLAGLARDRVGRVGRIATTALAWGMLFLGYEAGQTGGELVYRHGAARAFAEPGSTVDPTPDERSGTGRNGGR